MLIIVGREYEGLYQGLKARQEAKGRDRVILDRRSGERRQAMGLRQTRGDEPANAAFRCPTPSAR